MNSKQSPALILPQGPTCKKIQNYIFKFSDLLGQGNFSKVYKAHHEITDQIVAIKIIQLNSLKSKKLQQLLFSQINVLKKLNHPNILRCFQVFTSNRNCYIITQLCNQGDLESKLRKRHHFTQESVQNIIKDIFQGLMYLAEQKVIHRDLKVANVFMHNGKAKIADFGFAKFTQTKFKDINIGSPIYMSPQGFIENIYGPKTDIWAFGVLIYQLLHGQTPFNFCKTESQLKYNLSLPLNRSRIKQQISYDLQQVIISCMQIDQQKRIDAFQLSKLAYFQRIMKKGSSPMTLTTQNFHSTSADYRFRSPSYQTKQFLSNNKISSPLQYEQNSFPRKDSADRSPRENHLLTVNHVQSYDRGQSPLNGFKLQVKGQQSTKDNFYSTRNIQVKQHEIQSQQYQKRQRERGLTTQKRSPVPRSPLSIQKPQLTSVSRLPKIISSSLTFKQSVNLLHYARLLFKFIILLKQLKQYQQPSAEMLTLTKWLMLVLDQVSQKIQAKEVSYQGGTSPEVREKKLVEVTTQYHKKYRKELQTVIIQINLKDRGVNTLETLKTFIYNLYLQYDNIVYDDHSSNKNALVLAHHVLMIYQTSRLVKKCFDQKNYWLLQNYKEIQLFLAKTKDSMDLQSYKQKRKGMSIYN